MKAKRIEECSCCEVGIPPTPGEINNRFGLPAIAYRVGTYASFRQAMIEDIAQSPELADWTVRQSDDYGIALMEMWAYLADILTFYQERIANEAFLRTALHRDTIMRLASMLDYKLNPGVAAITYLAFFVEEGSKVHIPVGLRVQSVSGQDEKPQKFETIETLLADARLNQVRVFPKPQPANPFCLESTEGFLKPQLASYIAEGIASGDQFVVFSRGKNGTVEEKEVVALEEQETLTKLAWTPEIQSDARDLLNSISFKFVRKFRLFAYNAPVRYLHSYVDGNGDLKWKEIKEGDVVTVDSTTIDYAFDLPSSSTIYLDSIYDDLEIGTQILIPVRGESSGEAPIASVAANALYRLWNSSTKDHFYTMNISERDQAISDHGYRDEGLSGYIYSRQEHGTTPLYQLWNSSKADHFYTVDSNERDQAISNGYMDEGIAGYVFSRQEPGTTPLYRLWNPTKEDHFYTTKAIERNRAVNICGYTYEDIIVGYIYASNAVLTTVTSTRQVANEKGPLNATVTEITVADIIPPIENLREVEIYELAGPEIILWDKYYPDEISENANCVYVPLNQLDSIEPERTLILDDDQSDPQAVTVTRHMVRFTTVKNYSEIRSMMIKEAWIAVNQHSYWKAQFQRLSARIGQSRAIEVIARKLSNMDPEVDHLAITFTPSLKRSLNSKTAVLYGNVTEATHGETVSGEIVGSGDASIGFQEFILKKPPTTFIPAPNAPRGAKNTLEVRIAGVLWKEVESLYGQIFNDRVYTARVNDESKMSVRFGDGKTGARLPAGQDNVVATYRQGLGNEGNVRANSLTTQLDRPIGLKSVTNPKQAEGGTDPESLQEARLNAPNTVRTFERAISLRDYEDLARSYTGIAKARANSEIEDEVEAIHLTVAGEYGATIEIGSKLYDDLISYLDLHRDSNRILDVIPHKTIPLVLEAVIQVDYPAYLEENVIAAARTAVLNYFDFNNLQLGQGIHLSDMYAVLQGVEGVIAVDITSLYYREAEEPSLETHLRIEPDQIAALEEADLTISSDFTEKD